MSLLEDAIREHLELMRRRGADPAEIARAEREGLGPVEVSPGPAAPSVPSGPSAEEVGIMPAAPTSLDPHPADDATRVIRRPEHEEPDWAASETFAPPAEPLDPVVDDRDAGYRPPAPHPAAQNIEAFDEREVRESIGDAVDEAPFVEDDQHTVAFSAEDIAAATASNPIESPRAPVPGPEPAFEPDPEPDPEPVAEQSAPAPAPPAPESPRDPEPPVYERRDPEPVYERDPEPYDESALATDRRDVTEPAAAEQQPNQATGEDDVLEETPDFLQETPEHDRLWFEQRPPRDFDF